MAPARPVASGRPAPSPSLCGPPFPHPGLGRGVLQSSASTVGSAGFFLRWGPGRRGRSADAEPRPSFGRPSRGSAPRSLGPRRAPRLRPATAGSGLAARLLRPGAGRGQGAAGERDCPCGLQTQPLAAGPALERTEGRSPALKTGSRFACTPAKPRACRAPLVARWVGPDSGPAGVGAGRGSGEGKGAARPAHRPQPHLPSCVPPPTYRCSSYRPAPTRPAPPTSCSPQSPGVHARRGPRAFNLCWLPGPWPPTQGTHLPGEERASGNSGLGCGLEKSGKRFEGKTLLFLEEPRSNHRMGNQLDVVLTFRVRIITLLLRAPEAGTPAWRP